MMDMSENGSDPEALLDTRTRIRALAKAQGDHEDRIRSVEAWPQRIVFAVLAGATGMILTVAGFGWSLSGQLARMEARLDAAAASDDRRDARLDRLDDRAFTRSRSDSHGGE